MPTPSEHTGPPSSVGHRGPTPSSCSTPPTCPSFCRRHWFPTSISSPKFSTSGSPATSSLGSLVAGRIPISPLQARPSQSGGWRTTSPPPQSFSDMLSDPFHTVFYITFVLSTCALFSKVLAPSPPVERRSCHCHLDACRPRGTNSQLLNLARDLFDLQMVPHRKYSRAQHVRDQSVCGW